MNQKKYIQLTIWITSLVMVFHLCILIQLIPYNIAWGGRLHNDQEMYRFEATSILINLFLMIILSIKGALINFQLNKKVVQTILWIFFFIFILNTIGNLLAKTNFEKLFSILTLMLSFLMWKILRSEE